MANIFETVAMPRIPRNQFDLSHECKTSFNIGELVPTCVLDVIPGDSFRIGCDAMYRFAPLVSPVMHRIDVYTHYFFVPYRILWSGFEDFITGESDVDAPFVLLNDSTSNFDVGSIGHYLGIPAVPLATGQFRKVSPYIFAAYRKIYDEYYRDQNLIVSEMFVPLVPGDNGVNYGAGELEGQPPLIRSLEHDYFTSCLPYAQKGDPVMLPLTFQAGIPVELAVNPATPPYWQLADGSVPNGAVSQSTDTPTDIELTSSGDASAWYNPNNSLTVDVQSGAVTLDTLRTAIVLQEYLERLMRGGTRYIEYIQSQFGVRSSDARLQRPEYIGGARSVMAVSEVLSTSQSSNDPATATQFVGQMAGHGISGMSGQYFGFRAEEHGCIIGITSVLPETAYMQGLHRMWTKFDAIDDFAIPAFANLGEQVVLNEEVYLQTAAMSGTFGYQARYAEYKSIPSKVTGEFVDTLSFWHLAQDFDIEPALNQDFIEAQPVKFDRVFAVTDPDVDKIYARIIHRIQALRPLPRYGIPSFGSVSSGQ